MDHTLTPEDDDGWDANGFEIPSLDAGRRVGSNRKERSEHGETAWSGTLQRANSGGENIYLGPHGAPPSHSRQQEVATVSRKQRLKQKLKDAEKKATLLGRENKVEVLRDLMGTKSSLPATRGSAEEWLEHYCHESQFEGSSTSHSRS